MKNLKLILLTVFLFAFVFDETRLLAQSGTATDKIHDIETQIDSIFAGFDDIHKPGAAIAVVKEGKIVFKKGYGSANLEYDLPVTPSTIFHIASVSKQFTAFAILLLAEQGKLSFDDDIRKHIPEVPDFGKTITLRHLASHTSGMRDQWNLLALGGWRLDDVITKEHVLNLVSHQKELNFKPGEEYVYCNTGFTLLAEVVARVSGKSFAEFTMANIFQPLKMENTLFYDDHQKIVKNRAYSYYKSDIDYKKSVLSYANVGATSLFTTVEDLCLWAQNFSELKVGNANIIKQINSLAVLNNGETFGGAYGQFVNQYKGLTRIQHGGADAGYRTYFGRFPDQNFAVAVFSNYAFSNPNGLAMKVADLFLAKEMKEETTDKSTKEKTYKKLKKKELESYTGHYWNKKNLYSRKIYLKEDTLRYWRGEGNESLLVPIEKGTFQMLEVDVDLKVMFENKDNGKIMKVIVNDGEPIISEFYQPVTYSAEDLKQFTGTYFSEELETFYHLKVSDKGLIAVHFRTGEIELKPIKKDVFSGNKWYFGNAKFSRDNNNNITGLKVSSGRVRNLFLKKQQKAAE